MTQQIEQTNVAPAAPVAKAPAPVLPTRMNIMFGLTHVAHDQMHTEAARLLIAAAEQLTTNGRGEALKVNDTIILTDVNGNRVGVLDVFK